MPKNKKLSPFYFFLLDFKQQEEKKGRTFPNGLKDVQTDAKCNLAWQNLPESQKNYYKNKSKNSQFEAETKKKTTTGESLELIVKEHQENEQFLDNMQKNILSTLQEAKKYKSIPNLNFYVIHVNCFYSRTTDIETEYCPAEIAIAEFSLSKGITRTFHQIVNSEIQIGYTATATEYSRKTHQIPKNPSFGEKDYSVICEKICEFLEPGKRNKNLPPLYTRYNIDMKHPVTYVLNKLANYSKSLISFTVYSLEELYVNLRNINIEENNEEAKFDNTIASIKLQEDPYDCYKILQCNFHHMNEAGSFCSKSLVQRWIYAIFPYTCRVNGISFNNGIHVPVEEKVIINDTSQDFEECEFTKVSSRKIRTANIKSAVQNKVKNASERTCYEEDRRKAKSRQKPLEITYHSDSLDTRPPESKWDFEQQFKEISFDDNSFPSIEKGSQSKRKTFDNKQKFTDYASRLK